MYYSLYEVEKLHTHTHRNFVSLLMFFMKHYMQCFIGCLLPLLVEIWMSLWFFSFLPSWNYGCGWTQHDRLEFTPEASTSCFYWKSNSPFIKSLLMQVIWWFWNIFFAAFGWWFWQIWFGENLYQNCCYLQFLQFPVLLML